MLRRAPAVLAFICLSVASPAFAGGTSGVYARAQTRIPSGPDNSDFNSGLTGPVSAACQSDDLIPLGTFSFASAQADFGDLHAYGFSNGGISGILQNAMGEAAWFDEITIAGSGQVLVSFTFALDGTLTQSLPGPFSPASVGLIAGNVGSGSDVASFQRLASPVPMTVNTSVTLGPYVVDTNVPTNLTMRLVAYVNGVGEADFSSTAHFTGAFVTDLSGSPLAASISSDSGFNYIVPAPGVIPLLSLAGLCMGRRRR